METNNIRVAGDAGMVWSIPARRPDWHRDTLKVWGYIRNLASRLAERTMPEQCAP